MAARTEKREEPTDVTDDAANPGMPPTGTDPPAGLPPVTDRATFHTQLDGLRVREKA